MAYHQGRLVALVSHQSVRAVYHHTFRCVSKMLSQWWYTTVRPLMISTALPWWYAIPCGIDYIQCFALISTQENHPCMHLNVPDYQPLLSKRGGPLAVERFKTYNHSNRFSSFFISAPPMLHTRSASASFFILYFGASRINRRIFYETFRKKIQQKIIVAPNRFDYGFFHNAIYGCYGTGGCFYIV